ncbi:MAG TPA: hydantoinase B/oxoprolinase family protein [Stellaceae bacterium]|jgi:N-methylhydantoinase B|nr:hydantoinase B/oxoprolinase family protein [Stellaceae bacterium]
MDPITLEILSEGLISVVREMRATVFRTARSVAIYEAKDFSCGLFDPDTQVVAQSEDIGAHVVPLPWSVKFAMEDFAGDLAPGDVIVLNDPYRGGTHLNDVTLIYPVFAGGKLIFFPAVREHWADVGGAVPGSLSGTATEIYQEGVRIPPIKLVEAGKINKAAMDLILSNMRVPDERLGDFHAGMAACRTAEKRINELVARHGTETLLECVRINLDRSEARMRAQIALLPDGEFHYEDYLETFGDQGLDPLLLPLKLTIAGDTLTADFTGASPQVPVPVNSTLAVTAASVFITLKSALDPTAALNHGSFRPVEVIAPEGTIVNVRHPAPAGSHGEIRKRVVATMLGALSQIVPDLISGDIHRTSFHNLIGGIHPRTGKEYVHYEWSSGGNGAFAEDDGASAMATIDWGDLTTVQPSEVLETRFPLVVEWSRLGTDSGGDGAHRGGLGMRRALRLREGNATYSLLSDGAVVPPFGVLGGESAAPVDSFVMRDGREIRFAHPGKVGGFALREGDTVTLQSAGGGGYGDPIGRPAEAVAEDVREGYVTAVHAREMYGVVVTGGGVDAAATKTLRQEIRADRLFLTVRYRTKPLFAAGRYSRHRICPLHPGDAARLGVSDGAIVELVGRGGPALRAWAVIDEAMECGAVPLDPIGASIVGAKPGEALHVRPLRRVTVS